MVKIVGAGIVRSIGNPHRRRQRRLRPIAAGALLTNEARLHISGAPCIAIAPLSDSFCTRAAC
jgi:hypothetical protein